MAQPVATNLATPSHPRQTLGFIACVLAACFVLSVTWTKIDSVDTGYHLAYGARVLDGHGIVDRDPFLYPEHAVPFVNANWGSQVLMAMAYRFAGFSGLIALRTALIALIFVGIALILRCWSKEPHWLACVWLLAAVGAYERMSLRPEMFSYALMCWILALLVCGKYSKPILIAVTLLQFAWVNLHSYFLVGLMLTGSFLVGEVLWTIFCRSRTRLANLRWLALLFVLQIGVCFINPWGYRGAAFPLQTLSYLNREKVMGQDTADASANAWSLISEFHSPFRYVGELVNYRTMYAYYVLLVIAAAGIIFALCKRRLGPAIFLVLLMVMSFQMRRNIAQFALAGIPLALGAMATTGVPRRSTQGIVSAMVILLSSWWTYGVLNGRFFYEERRVTRQFGVGSSERTFPKSSVRWLASQPDIKPNLFVDYFASSNTLPWLPERFKLFVDTNTFACEEATLAAAFDVGLGKRDHAELFDREHVNVALLHCGPDTQTLVRRLVADYTNWALVYFDRQAVIFLRRIPEHVPIILANKCTEASLDAKAWIVACDEPAFTKALSLGAAVNVPLSMGWNVPAADLMREAVRLAPDYHEAWYFLAVSVANAGNAEARKKDFSAARAAYQSALDAATKALSLFPQHAQARALQRDMQEVLQAMPNP